MRPLPCPHLRRAPRRGREGGAVEVRFLPLVKTHDWAFAAAECAAALAAVGPELYKRYEETLFARQEKTDAAVARQLAADIAEAAGAKEKFEAELASGRPREHIVRDVVLAMRLGISSTPSFLYGGTFFSGEKGLLESYLWERLPAPARTQANTE